MNKIFKGIIASLAAFSMTATAFAATFSDVEGTAYDWANAYVEDMAEKGLISGYEDGTFRPQNTVSKIEAISLFARAMGSRSAIHKDTVDTALEKYDEFIENLDLKFGKEDVAFLLYHGALTETEMNAYLSGDTKNKPMLRHEAATVIVKAMGLDAEAKRNLVLDLSYTDVKDIPSAAKKYVYMVTEKNIMAGGGDGTFSPNTEVQRSQIAVMLSKTVDAMDITFSDVNITKIDSEAKELKVKTSDGDSATLEYTEDTLFFIEGEKVSADKVALGVNAIITTTNDGMLFVDILSAVPDVEDSFVFRGTVTENDTVYIKVSEIFESAVSSYELSEDAVIIKDGEEIDVKDILDGDFILVKTSLGKVTNVNVLKKDASIKGAILESTDVKDETLYITIAHEDDNYDGLVLAFAKDVTISKDGAEVSMDKVYRGDKLSLTLEYGLVKKVVASGNKITVEGTIRSINISANPTITVLVKNNEVTYDITRDIKIFVNGVEATLYDFRVGNSVTLTTESSAVVKIESVTSTITEGNVSGTVTTVDPSSKHISVRTADGTGNIYEEKVYCSDSKTTLISADGSTKMFRDIKKGSVVNAYGEYNNGRFEAKSIVIVK